MQTPLRGRKFKDMDNSMVSNDSRLTYGGSNSAAQGSRKESRSRSSARRNNPLSQSVLQPVRKSVAGALGTSILKKGLKGDSVTPSKDNVKVVIRCRPHNVTERERNNKNQGLCVTVEDEEKISLERDQDTKQFTFDYVASSQTG
jgi:hypothetical protein